MNTEKEITITDLRGKFTKDFDTFGKMDPFVEFVIGKTIARTETANGAGKEPQWKNSIVLTYFDETAITLRAYDEDATENEFIGTGKVQVKGLRFPGGTIDVNILTDSGENIGTISGKYTIKNLNPTPLLLLKNIRCSFVKEHSFITKTKPYLQAACEEVTATTDSKEEAQGLSLAWTDGLRLRVKENSKITLSLLDKNDNGASIFKYECTAKEFRLQAGSKKFNVFGNDYLYLGTLQFDFETVNLVSKEESVKNAEKEKKSDSELTSISLEKVRTELVTAGRDLYYHFVIGTNMIATEVTKNTSASSSIDLKRTLYADTRQNKLTVLIWQKNMLRDKVVASGSLPLQGLSSGDRKVSLIDGDNKDAGSVWLSLVVKQVPAKILLLDGISVQLTVSADLIGESEPYLVARIGGASGRTETGDKNNYSFKRGIELKGGEQEILELQLWEEDVTNDELLYTEKVKLSEFKGVKGDLSFKLVKAGETAPTARLSFKYDLKINAPPPEPSKKLSEKKPVQEPKPASKVEAAPQKVEPVPQKVQQPVEPPKVVVQEKKPEPEAKKEVIAVQEPKRKVSDVKTKLEQASKTIQQPLQPPHTDTNRKRKTEESLQNSQLKRSLQKDSILPSINISHQNYGDRIFEKQSAATLQKSIVAYSMPKANRFTNEPKYSGEPSYCVDSCFKSSSMKGVGFGFGRKKQFPDWVERNMKENPAPGTYFEANSDLRSKGPTFGIAHKFYEKVMIPKEKLVPKTTHRKLSPIHK